MKEKWPKSRIIKLIVFLALLAVTIPVGFLTGVFEADDFGESFGFDVTRIFKVIVMLAAVLLVENLLLFLLGLIKTQKHRTGSILSLISSVIRYATFVIALCWGLTLMGVNVSTIVASVGVIALIVGFSAESLIADLVTGAFILFENQYNVGDIVEVGGFRGTVSSIGIRTTTIVDAGGNIKIVNNSDMKNILNRSNKASRSVSTIGIPYATDLEKLESQIPALCEKIRAKHPDMMLKAPEYLGVDALADSAVVLKFIVEVAESNIFAGARTLNRELLLGFRELGVECPFPQVDAHVDRLES